MSIFVIERDLPVALVIEARREFDRLCTTISGTTAISPATTGRVAENGPEVIAGLYLPGPGRSLSIVRVHSHSAVLGLLDDAGLRHSVVHRASAFPHQSCAGQ